MLSPKDSPLGKQLAQYVCVRITRMDDVDVGLFDLLQAVKVSLAEPAWVGFGAEGYLFVALVYFAFCFAMSRYAATLEKAPSARLSALPSALP